MAWRGVVSSLVGAALIAGALTVALETTGAGATSSTNVVTYDYNNSRSGDDPVHGAVASLSAHPTWNAVLDGAVYGEPLLYQGRVYVGTEDDTLYALNATNGSVIWRRQLGTAVSTAVIDEATGLGTGCGDIDPLGITGTPVIDPANNEIYVADETMVGATRWQHIRHDLLAVSLSTHEVRWTRDIDPPGGDTADGYSIPAQQQRPALTLANGKVYVGFGGLAGDCGEYHGWEVGVPASGRGATIHYQTPSLTEAAIWETNGAVVNSAGDLFVATGNGASQSAYDGSDGVIELSPTLHVLGEWAPMNWRALSANDWDLGSAGPIPVPGTSDLFIAGKPVSGSAPGFLLSATALGAGPGAPLFQGNVCTGGGDFGADATDVVTSGGVSHTYIYAACNSGLAALLFKGGGSPSFSVAWTPSTGDPIGPPVVADGLVWSLDWRGAELFALAPTTGVVRFSRATASLDHFATPTVSGNRVLVPTQGGVEAFSIAS
jgi:polyvinyl alcohol dehydrogenase (cytochrome)